HLHLVRDGSILDFQGLPIYIETAKGEIRKGNGWSTKMPAHYGYFRLTGSAEGPAEGLDCFVGDNHKAPNAYIIEQLNPDTGSFDEHKVILGVTSMKDALSLYQSSYGDGVDRAGGVQLIPVKELPTWMQKQGFMAPAA